MSTDHRTARLTAWLATAAIMLVTLTPMVLSAQSLAAWAREALGLSGVFAILVPVSLDAAALACVALALTATLRGDAGGAPKVLAWVLVAGSALANHRHGQGIGPDAEVYYPALPVLAMTLVELGLRYTRRSALVDAGRTEPVLPRFRAARWAVAPVETFAAWRAAVVDGHTSPAAAVSAVRRRREGEVPAVASSAAPGAESPHQLSADARELAGMSKADQLRAAFVAIGEVSAPRALTWLARRGVEVSSRYAHEVAAVELARGPELVAIEGGGAS
jgi:hypothetical protein